VADWEMKVGLPVLVELIRILGNRSILEEVKVTLIDNVDWLQNCCLY
jgi:hypothetical protein